MNWQEINSMPKSDSFEMWDLSSIVVDSDTSREKTEDLTSQTQMYSDTPIKNTEQAAWRRACRQFLEITTIHGVRQAWDESSFRGRRLIWLLLVLAGMGIMLFQIIDRIKYFRSWPANVNVNIKFNSSLPFPAVTICNQNAYKASVAAEDERYELVEAMHSTQGISLYKLQSVYNASDIPLDDLLTRAAHRKEDMIVRCEWGRSECHPGNFTRKLTDHGVCFTFNNVQNEDNPLMVSNSGVDDGLRLTLNVEQYEYMPGPHGAAGVKIFIHDRDDFPMVGDLGLAIPTGSQTFVGTSLYVLTNLRQPYGECDRKTMTYFSNEGPYTTALCEIDCLTTEMARVCGCRVAYLPHVDGYPRVCNLREYYQCVIPFLRNFRDTEVEICGCFVPCEVQTYNPTISYATSSSFLTDRLLPYLDKAQLRQKYIRAREVTHRFEADKSSNFNRLADNLRDTLAAVDNLLKTEIRIKLDAQKAELANRKLEVYQAWHNITVYLEYQEYCFRRGFLRALESMEEGTLDEIGKGYQAFILEMNVLLHGLANMSSDKNVSKHNLHLLLRTKVHVETVMIDRGIANITELINAYANGTAILDCTFPNEDFQSTITDNLYIVPKQLLKESLNRTLDSRQYVARTLPDLETLKDKAKMYYPVIEAAYHNGTLDEQNLLTVESLYAEYNKKHLDNKAGLDSELREWPKQQLEDGINSFNNLWTEYIKIQTNTETDIDAIVSRLDTVENNALSVLKKVSELTQNYNRNSSINKIDIANEILSHRIIKDKDALINFFDLVRSQGHDIYLGWKNLADSAGEIWKEILTNENLQQFYIWKGDVDFLQNLTEVRCKLYDDYHTIREQNDISNVIGTNDSDLFASIDEMKEAMKIFIESTQLDTQFFRENFVFLDVFYSQLSYEEVTQQEVYGIFPLLCDIGGSVGLFLGASVMSLFEVVDLIIELSLQHLLRQ